VIDSGLVGNEVSQREKMALRGTDPESYITEYTLVNEDEIKLRPQFVKYFCGVITFAMPSMRCWLRFWSWTEADCILCNRRERRRLSTCIRSAERDFLIDKLLVRIHLIIEMILVDQPCVIGV